MRSLRRKREAPSGSQVNAAPSARRNPALGNQARLRRLGPFGPGPGPVVSIDHFDVGAPVGATFNPNNSSSDQISTVDGGAATPDAGVPAADAGAPAPDGGGAGGGVAGPAKDGGAGPAKDGGAPAPAPAAPAAPACQCELASGPTYTPTGSVPVTNAGGVKFAHFDFSASFTNNAAQNKIPSCCHVRQYVKWNAAFATWNGGPPHAGIPASTPSDTWIEDRDNTDHARYGHRSGPHSVPFPNCGNQYKTGATQDMANGDTYCGNDNPGGPSDMVGSFSFQLVVYDTPGAPVARSSVINVNWG